MAATGRSQLLGAVGFWLIAGPLARWAWDRAAAPGARRPGAAPAEPPLAIALAPAHSPYGCALREARTEWIRYSAAGT
jgi:hypothetical protein